MDRRKLAPTAAGHFLTSPAKRRLMHFKGRSISIETAVFPFGITLAEEVSIILAVSEAVAMPRPRKR